ncbi:MAG: signal peptidase I [Patescibacteria group bacterium]
MMTAEERKVSKKGDEYLGLGGLLLEMVKVFLLAVVIIIPVRVFLFQPFFVQGSSMEPNFQDGQYLVISEFGYKQTSLDFLNRLGFTVEPFKEIGRQDVSVFHYPKNPEQYFIKRVIALPGESVEIKKNKVIIYNEAHPEGFVLDETAYLSKEILMQDMPRLTVGAEEYFVMGDNRMFSYDSRSIGPIPKEKIIGRVLLRAWPIEKASLY